MSLAAICLVAGSLHVTLPATHFTLVWRHSIEKIDWEEDYQVAGDRLHLSEARVRGDGAGMEPPPDAVLYRGWWQYHPAQRWHRALHLARSHFTQDYRLCLDGQCLPMAHWVPIDAAPVLTVMPCRLPGGAGAPPAR